jgi:hypothetical protein
VTDDGPGIPILTCRICLSLSFVWTDHDPRKRGLRSWPEHRETHR